MTTQKKVELSACRQKQMETAESLWGKKVKHWYNEMHSFVQAIYTCCNTPSRMFPTTIISFFSGHQTNMSEVETCFKGTKVVASQCEI